MQLHVSIEGAFTDECFVTFRTLQFQGIILDSDSVRRVELFTPTIPTIMVHLQFQNSVRVNYFAENHFILTQPLYISYNNIIQCTYRN